MTTSPLSNNKPQIQAELPIMPSYEHDAMTSRIALVREQTEAEH